MHTDQYLQWDSHHNLAAKYSVISTLTHRARTVCTKPELLNPEIQHLRKALTKCKYPKWTLDKIERRFISNNQEESNEGNNQREQSEGNKVILTTPVVTLREGTPSKRSTTRDTVIPYTQGLGVNIQNICKKYGIQTHFKGNRTIKNILVKPKYKDHLDRKSGAVLLVPMWGAHI